MDYGYDGQGRVNTLVEKLNSVPTPLASYTYTYDRGGNRLSATEIVNGTTRNVAWAYDGANRLLSESLNSVTTSYTYDDAGNRLTETSGSTTTNYTYNAMNQLTQKVKGTETYTYTYDNRGNLTKEVKKTGTTTNF